MLKIGLSCWLKKLAYAIGAISTDAFGKLGLDLSTRPHSAPEI